jgi:ABC-type cobalamin/Fe3+-siderophores transport system ATPase subunit
MLFEVQGLSKRFGQLTALSDVSFHVRAGEVLGLIGPNGAGKSTLFECLAGVLPCDRGAIRVHGRTVGTAERPTVLFYVPDSIAPWGAQSLRWVLPARSAWRELKLAVEGANLKAWLDGVPALEYTLGSEPVEGRRGAKSGPLSRQ